MARELRQERHHTVYDAAEIHAEDPVPVRVAHLVDRPGDVYAGIVEEQVYGAAALDHLVTGAPTAHTTPEQARINLETTIAIERAVATGKPVRLPLET